jgi:hypothetical protein
MHFSSPRRGSFGISRSSLKFHFSPIDNDQNSKFRPDPQILDCRIVATDAKIDALLYEIHNITNGE